jgi:hypothetical protein
LIDRFEGITFVPAVRTVKQIVLGESSVVVVVAVVVQVVGATESGGAWRNLKNVKIIWRFLAS